MFENKNKLIFLSFCFMIIFMITACGSGKSAMEKAGPEYNQKLKGGVGWDK